MPIHNIQKKMLDVASGACLGLYNELKPSLGAGWWSHTPLIPALCRISKDKLVYRENSKEKHFWEK